MKQRRTSELTREAWTLSSGQSVDVVGATLRVVGRDRRPRYLSPAASAVVSLADGSRTGEKIAAEAAKLFGRPGDAKAMEFFRAILEELVQQNLLRDAGPDRLAGRVP